MNRQEPIENIEVTPHVIVNPVGVDAIITNLQVELGAKLSWLEKSFGKAETVVKEENGNEFAFPAILISKTQDMLPLIPNDNFTAYSFFLTSSDEEVIEYQNHIPNFYARTISAIFWISNLRKVDDTKLYNFREELILEAKKVIRSANIGDGNFVTLTTMVDDPQDIYEGFTVESIKKQLLTYPATGFRINMIANYQGSENC